MLHYHRLFKFLNKIKSKYLEESSEGEGEMETPPLAPHMALLGSHRGCGYSGSRTSPA